MTALNLINLFDLSYEGFLSLLKRVEWKLSAESF